MDEKTLKLKDTHPALKASLRSLVEKLLVTDTRRL
jgi:hypothetical protein